METVTVSRGELEDRSLWEFKGRRDGFSYFMRLSDMTAWKISPEMLRRDVPSFTLMTARRGA